MHKLVFLSVCISWLAPPASAQEITAREIVARSAEADRGNLLKAKDYTYTERRERRRAGIVESKTYDVTILDGTPYRRLIARNDKPLSEVEALKVSAEFEKERRTRLRESAADRRRRLEREEKQNRESRRFIAEIPSAFELTLRGEDQVSGVSAWVIDAEPRSNYVPQRNADSDMLRKFRGRLWIEKRTYQWVKVEAETIGSIRRGLVLLRLDPGTKLTFEQTFVNGELWLPKRISAKANGRIALFKKLAVDQQVTFTAYRKFKTDSRLIADP
jgi:hypothetical protein